MSTQQNSPEKDTTLKATQGDQKEHNNECVLCTNPKLETGEYCEWCQSKRDSYEPDEKEGE